MDRRPFDVRILAACSAIVVLGCAVSYFLFDRRIRQEREAMRDMVRNDMQGVVKDGIKGAADDMLSKEYVEKKVSTEATKLLSDPPVEAVGDATRAGLKTGARAAKELLKTVTENKEEIRELGKTTGEAARVGLETALDAAKQLLAPPQKENEPPKEEAK